MTRPTPIPAEELLAEAGFLQRLARGLVTDAHGADDLVQDTLVAALEHPPRRPGPIRAWLATIAANLARNRRREGGRREQREHDATRAELVTGDEVARERIEMQRLLFETVLTLPAEQRTVLYLRYYEDRTPTAIAAQLSVPLKTVKSRHTRAIGALRAKLDARSGGDRSVWMEALAPFVALRGAEVVGSVVPMTIGGIVVKKLVVAGAAALLLVLAWFVLSREGPIERVAATDRSVPVELERAATTPRTQLSEAPPLARESMSTSASRTTGALEVHLRWSDGTPAAEVGLSVRCTADPAPRSEPFRSSSDAHGVVRFPTLFAGKVTLVPDMRQRFDLRDRFETEVEAGATRTIELSFEGGTDVIGRVVDPDGKAVGTASIWCDGAALYSSYSIRATLCDGDGSFRLRDLSGNAVIGARAPGYRASVATRVEDIAIGPDGARLIELCLGEGGGRVRGCVLDPSGAPLEHAIVAVGPRGGGRTQGMTGAFPKPGAVETDADGRFEVVDDLAPGKHPVHVSARAYPVWVGEVEIVAGAAASLEIRLERPARIEGRVLDLEGKPIGGVVVLASKEDRGGWYEEVLPASRAVSDAQGKFVLDWIRSGPCEINANDYSRPEIGRGHSEVVCAAGETIACDVKLVRGNTIAGRVEDANGVGLGGWRVYAQATSFMNQWHPRQTRTASDGSFTLLNLGEGQHDLIVRAPDFQVAPRARASRIAAGSVDVVLVVTDAAAKIGTVRGRLVDPRARSVADVRITLWRTDQDVGSYVDVDPRTGMFEARVQTGRYRIQAQRSRRTLLTSPDFVVEEGRVAELGDMALGELGRAEFRFTNLPKELEKSYFSVQRADNMESVALTREGDVWKSEDLLSGTWVVGVFESEIFLRGAVIQVPAHGTARAEIVVERACRVGFTIVDPGKGAITIEARDAAGALLVCRRMGFDKKDDRARFDLGLPPGRASVTVRTLEGLSGTVEIDVVAGLKTPVEIPLR